MVGSSSTEPDKNKKCQNKIKAKKNHQIWIIYNQQEPVDFCNLGINVKDYENENRGGSPSVVFKYY